MVLRVSLISKQTTIEPSAPKKERKPLSAEAKAKLKQYKQSKLTWDQRKERVAEKKKAYLAAQSTYSCENSSCR